MTIDLVDGKAGKAHIDSDDRGSFNIGTMGSGCYVLNVKNKFALTMESANSGTVDTGGLIMWGRYVHCTEPETITVENGSQNMKRNDLVVMRYTKTTDKIETASLVVIKGTPAASTPADPQINEVDEITSTTTIADMPLYRIPLDGITVGEPVPLFNVLAPMSELWDSVTHIETAQVRAGWSDSKFTLVKRNGVVTTCGQIGLSSNITSLINLRMSQTIPEGFRPKDHGAILLIGNNNQTQEYHIGADGTMTLSTGGANAGYYFTYTGSWVVA